MEYHSFRVQVLGVGSTEGFVQPVSNKIGKEQHDQEGYKYYSSLFYPEAPYLCLMALLFPELLEAFVLLDSVSVTFCLLSGPIFKVPCEILGLFNEPSQVFVTSSVASYLSLLP